MTVDHKVLTILKLASALVLAAIAVTAAQDQSSTRQITLTLTEGTAFTATASPDRNWIAIDVLGAIWLVPFNGGDGKRVTPDTIEARHPSWSPDNHAIAFEGYDDGPWHIYTVNIQGARPEAPQAMTSGVFEDREPAWSRDGRRIAFVSDRGGGTTSIWTVTTAERHLEQVTTETSETPTWAPADRELTIATPRGIVSVDGRGRERVLVEAKEDGAGRWPAWNPEGTQLAFVRDGRLVVDTQPIAAASEDVFDARPQFLSAGEILYTADGRIRKRSLASGMTTVVPFSIRVTFPRTTFTRSHRTLEPSEPQVAHGIASPAVSPDGRVVAFSALGDLWIAPANGGSPRRITNSPAVKLDPAWSPDGLKLAYSSDATGRQMLFIVDLATLRTEAPAPQEKGDVTGAAWSPDGDRIAYVVDGHEIATVAARADVRGRFARFMPRAVATVGRPTWSRDSKALSVGSLFPFAVLRPEGLNQLIVHTFEPVGDTSVLLFPDRSAGDREHDGPVWAPDGLHMAFVSGDELWVAPIDLQAVPTGAPIMIANDHPSAPSWEADSRHLVYVTPDGLRRISSFGGEPSVPIDNGLGWSPSQPPGPTVVHAGRVFTGRPGGLLYDVDIVVDHGVIQDIGAHDDTRHVGSVIDASNETVGPGFIDMNASDDVTRSEGAGRLWLSYGVTSVRAVAVDPYLALATREALDNGRRRGPRVFSSGGPIDGWRVWDEGGVSIAPGTDIARILDRAAALGADMLATRTRLPNRDYRRTSEFAHAHGLAVSSAHLMPALTAGLDYLEELPAGAYRDVTSSMGAVGMTVGSRFGLPALIAMARADPGIVRDDRVALVPGGPERLRGFASGTPPGSRFFVRRFQILKDLIDAGGRLVVATDPRVGLQGLTLHAEMQQLVRDGFTAEQALRAATAEAAAALGIDDQVGTVEPGKLADLVFLDGDPLADIRATRQVRRVMRGGRLYTRSDLVR